MDGQQNHLGITDPKDEAGAWTRLDQLLKDVAQIKSAVAGPGVRRGAVDDLAALFLREKVAVADRTLKGYGRHLAWLAKHFRGQVADLDVQAVILRAAAEEGWGDTHRANVLWTVGAFIRWCGRSEVIPLPPKESRGAESLVSEAVYRRCLTESHGDFQQLIRFLWHTGCRPGEATGLTVEAVDWDTRTVTLKKHKTKHKGKKRVLFLGTEAAAVLADQRAKHKTGLLFRGLKGERLSLQAMTMRFERLSEKVGARVTSYMFRHTWATRALAAGEPDTHVAAALGHTSTAMVHKHYGHITANARLLQDMVDRVSSAKPKAAG